MRHPLENTWLKLKRADKHLNEIQRKFDNFAARDPYRSVRYTDPERGYRIYKTQWLRNPPKSVGPVIGDAVHDMRSSLDNLAWALALTKTKTPGRQTAFPLFKQRNDGRFKPMVRDIPDAAQKIIEELQPHNSSDLAGKHPLAVLDYLSNLDKHQVLVPIGTLINAPVRHIPGASMVRLDDRQIQVELPIDVDPGAYFEENFTFQITIRVPAFAPNGLDFYRLRDISQFIRQDVIPRFMCFFPVP